MNTPTLPAARRFLDQVRALHAEDLEEAALWGRIEDAMGPLLADPGLRESTNNWPATVESAPTVGNLLFYEDPDYGFVFNATVRQPHVISIVHDHGAVWTLYGLIKGHETMYRYERTDDGPADRGPATLELLGSHDIGPGDIDVSATPIRPRNRRRENQSRPKADPPPTGVAAWEASRPVANAARAGMQIGELV